MREARTTKLQAELKTTVRGDVLFDDMSRLIYSTDASLYQIKPLGVVVPRDKDDVVATVRIAARYGVPLMGRGGGTSLAGQTVTEGLVLDFSKYMNRVLEIDAEERWARVQPGIVLDNLNDFLKVYGLFFAPDVATSSRANVGGMIGNNSSGVRSIRYGKTVDHVIGLNTVLSDGSEAAFFPLSRTELETKCSQDDIQGNLYKGIHELVERNRELIQQKFPKVMRRVSGYNLDEMLDDSNFNLSKLIVGSEGTLSVVTEAKLNLVPIPPHRFLTVLHFDDLLTAIHTVQYILDYNPTAVEILDRYGIELAHENPVVSRLCRQFIQGDPDAILIVEFSGDSESSIQSEFEGMGQDSRISRHVTHTYEASDEAAQQVVWQVRKNALGVMLGIKGDYKPLPFIEDSCIPVDHLAEYIEEIQEICSKYKRRMALYAHASVGVIHVRPLLNLKQQEDLEILQRISEETFDLVLKYKGSWSGEHGDGLVRSYKIEEFFGSELYAAFKEVKSLFDPAGLMNPGKIVNSQTMTENLRIHPEYKTAFPQTYFRFEAEGGFDQAIEMCTGVGQCRKTLAGTMCPSFIATREEEHSTRGRANALRSAMAGDLGFEGFTSKRLYDVLDLCVECKACKSECPSSVDMAKIKAEFLTHYYKEHGLPLRKRLVGATRRTAELATYIPRTTNFLLRNRLSRQVLELVAGIDHRRKLPPFASQTLTSWYGKQNGKPVGLGPNRVILFADTFVNFYEPSVGKSAFQVLSALGFRVEVANPGCCARPLISAGLLDQAKSEGAKLIANLKEVAQQRIPIVILEPSCYSTIKDDLPDLLDDRESALVVAEQVVSLEEFLNQEGISERLARQLDAGPASVLFHGHCQQKALVGSEPTLEVLSKIPGSTIEEVPSGCCGMAGSFGYEKEHYAMSEKMGSRHLFPAIRRKKGDSTVVVSGFSCRCQTSHFTETSAVHPAELLASCLKTQ